MPIWNSIKNLLRVENQNQRHRDEHRRIQRIFDEDRQAATLTLADYVNLLSGVPLPSTQQKTEFAEFVSTSHSWYKHLPVNPPGQQFYFFLDKYAGCDLRLLNDIASPMERNKQGQHHSFIPTAEYRSRFGYLDFGCGRVPAVPGDGGKMHGLPKEILEVGGAPLTAIVHEDSPVYRVCSQMTDWPEELGGRTALEKIAARCREMQDPATPQLVRYTSLSYVDPLLDDLVAPERQRQKREIVRSIDRVCELIRAGWAQPDLSESRYVR